MSGAAGGRPLRAVHAGRSRPLRLLRAAVLALAAATPIAATSGGAQTPPRITVRVRQVAGSSIYLDVGSAHGLQTGDTVGVARDSLGPPVASLVVNATSQSRSVLSFSSGAFEVAGGEPLTLILARAPTAPVPESARPAAAAPPAAPGARVERQVVVAPPRAAPRGRIALDLAAVRSAARVRESGSEDVRHIFATPALLFDVSIPDAVAGFDLRAGSRLAYRYSDPDLSTPAASARVYSAALERRFERVPVRLALGRFHSPDEFYSGFWDGLHLRYGRSTGVAVLLGLQPDRWNEAPSLDRPKASFVLDATRAGGGWRWSGDLSAHYVSASGLLPAHSFAGLSQSVRAGSLTVAQDLQIDRDQQAGAWRVSRAGVRGSLSLPGADVRAGFLRRETYRDWWGENAFSPREDRISAGVSVRMEDTYLAADVSHTLGSDGGSSTGFTGALVAPGVLPSGAQLEASGSYWSGAYGRAWSAAPSVAFGGSGARWRVGYRIYGSDFLERATTTHAGELTADLPVGPGRRVTLRFRVQRGGSLASEDLALTLYRLF